MTSKSMKIELLKCIVELHTKIIQKSIFFEASNPCISLKTLILREGGSEMGDLGVVRGSGVIRR